MPVTLKQVVEHVAAMEEPGSVDKVRLEKQLREAIHIVGLAVNPRNDEVYDPAGPPPARYVDGRGTFVKRGLPQPRRR